MRAYNKQLGSAFRHSFFQCLPMSDLAYVSELRARLKHSYDIPRNRGELHAIISLGGCFAAVFDLVCGMARQVPPTMELAKATDEE